MAELKAEKTMGKYKLFERISFFIIIIFALVGSAFIGTAMHEVSHFKDLHQYVSNDYICAFVWPTSLDYFKDILHSPLGYYYYASTNNSKQVNEILKHTEIRAYIISIAILIIFFVAIFFQIIERRSNKEKTELLNDLEEEMQKQKHLNTLNNLNEDEY